MTSIVIPKVPYPTFGKFPRAGLAHGPEGDLIAVPGSDFAMFTKDYVFVGDTANAELNLRTNGTSAAVAAAATSGNGLELTTGTDSAGYAGISLSLGPWKGSLGVLYECWLELPATITTLKFEAGITDALDDAGAVNVKATPTATATDFAAFCFDTTHNTALGFFSAKTDVVVGSQAVLAAVTGSDKFYFAIRVDGNNVEAWYSLNGARTLTKVTGHGANAGINGASALTPWVFAQAKAGSASRIVTVKRMRITGPVI